jgi:hypothetical protein
VVQQVPGRADTADRESKRREALSKSRDADAECSVTCIVIGIEHLPPKLGLFDNGPESCEKCFGEALLAGRKKDHLSRGSDDTVFVDGRKPEMGPTMLQQRPDSSSDVAVVTRHSDPVFEAVSTDRRRRVGSDQQEAGLASCDEPVMVRSLFGPPDQCNVGFLARRQVHLGAVSAVHPTVSSCVVLLSPFGAESSAVAPGETGIRLHGVSSGEGDATGSLRPCERP